ncbi:MAG: LysR family transcriptional regulator [Gammaproteobacteria bacterium]
MSDLDRFELFIYVAQANSLTQAASLLGTTKASLSKQIKRLETDFKVDLFSRHAQRLQLTAQGKILLEQCLRLKKELDDARSICQQFHKEPEGILHIVAFEYFAKQLIFPKLKAFVHRYPKLQLFIDTSERIPNFESEQVDLAVGFSLPAPMDIVRRKIATTCYVLCASPHYFSENGKPRNLKELLNHSYIGHRSRPEEQTINLKPGYKLSLKPYLLLNSVTSMIECAKEGLGLVQLPLYMLKKALHEGELVEVLEDYQATNVNVYYYYPKYRYVQPKVRKFIDFFLMEE